MCHIGQTADKLEKARDSIVCRHNTDKRYQNPKSSTFINKKLNCVEINLAKKYNLTLLELIELDYGLERQNWTSDENDHRCKELLLKTCVH